MGTLKEDLIAAKALIDAPEKWAANDDEIWDDKFCIVTALDEVSWERRVPMQAALDSVLPDGPHTVFPTAALRLEAFNDRHDHADVMALFNRAIEAAE